MFPFISFEALPSVFGFGSQEDLVLVLNACGKGGNGNVEMLKVTFSKYPDLFNKALDGTGNTALILSARYQHFNIVEYLLTRKEVSINKTNNWGWTALFSACYKGNTEIVPLLLSHPEIDVNIQTLNGWTALHVATYNRNVEIVRILLSRTDINVNLCTTLGFSALGDARSCPEIFPLFQEFQSRAVKTQEPGREFITGNEMKRRSGKVSNDEQLLVSDEQFIDDDAKSFDDLKFPPLLRLSYVTLKESIVEDELKEAKKSKAFGWLTEINKEKKRLKSWIEMLSQAVGEEIPVELTSGDFFIVKQYTIQLLEDHFENCLENNETAQLLAGIDAFKSMVEQMALTTLAVSPVPFLSEASQSSHFKSRSSLLPLSPPLLAAGKRFHVFLTHNWADDELGRNNHQRVSKINKILMEYGLITWFDEERMNGQLRQAMSEALVDSMMVLCFITKIYEEKINKGDRADNCYFEFNLATNDPYLVNHLIPIAMDKSMLNPSQWQRGRLRSELGGELVVDMTEDDNQAQIQQLMSHILAMLDRNRQDS